jgi:hypothetical protein
MTGRSSSVHGPHAPARFFSQARGLVLTLLVALFLAAVLSGRVLAPALLGWRAGIERLIERSELVAAVLGQLAVVAGALMAIQLLIATLVESDLNVAFRLVAAPITAGVVTLVMAAATHELPTLLSLTLAVLTGVLALIASAPTLLRAHTRATGLVLLFGGLTAILQVVSRVLALWASQESSIGAFHAARSLSTVVLVLDLTALAAAGTWLAERRFKLAGAVAFAALAASVGLAYAALRGAGWPGGWLVFASQAMHGLARHPWPLVPPVVYFTVQVALLLGVVLSLSTRRAQPFARTAIALALLARPGTDIPVMALSLLLAALLGPLAAAREGALSSPEKSDGGNRETNEREQQPPPPADAAVS